MTAPIRPSSTSLPNARKKGGHTPTEKAGGPNGFSPLTPWIWRKNDCRRGPSLTDGRKDRPILFGGWALPFLDHAYDRQVGHRKVSRQAPMTELDHQTPGDDDSQS